MWDFYIEVGIKQEWFQIESFTCSSSTNSDLQTSLPKNQKMLLAIFVARA